MRLRVAAIDFLNPAPLMWDFSHEPTQSELRGRYDVTYTEPAQCARDLLRGRADLGLIPIAALTPELAVVPGCAIASLRRVRSIQLIVKAPLALRQVRSVAADQASRSSVAYAQVLFRHFLGATPRFESARANVEQMLAHNDAALLIGDPALLALERRSEIEQSVGPCAWHDLAELWHGLTGMPWVAAVWALQTDAAPTPTERRQVIDDLNRSRIHGMQHIDDLVREWTGRIALPASTIRAYLTENIHYVLDAACMEAIVHFRALAAEEGILPPLASPTLLHA